MFSGRKSGTLVVSNENQSAHNLNLSLSKLSNGDIVPTYSSSEPRPSPTQTPMWSDEFSYKLSSNETIEENQFITEGGTYYFEVSVTGLDTEAAWHYFSSSEGDKVTGGFINITIQANGLLNIDFPVSD